METSTPKQHIGLLSSSYFLHFKHCGPEGLDPWKTLLTVNSLSVTQQSLAHLMKCFDATHPSDISEHSKNAGQMNN